VGCLSESAWGLWRLSDERLAAYALGLLDFYPAVQHLWEGAAAWVGGRSTQARQQYEALLAEFTAETQRYNTEQKDIEKDAKKLEHERDVNRKREPYFDFVEVLLQIAIVMSSGSILSSSRLMYGLSLILALGGTCLMINGYTLWVMLPFFHGGH
jgi:hypothetical protein